jgi:hypothetical protein
VSATSLHPPLHNSLHDLNLNLNCNHEYASKLSCQKITLYSQSFYKYDYLIYTTCFTIRDIHHTMYMQIGYAVIKKRIMKNLSHKIYVYNNASLFDDMHYNYNK